MQAQKAKPIDLFCVRGYQQVKRICVGQAQPIGYTLEQQHIGAMYPQASEGLSWSIRR